MAIITKYIISKNELVYTLYILYIICVQLFVYTNTFRLQVKNIYIKMSTSHWKFNKILYLKF